MKKLIILALALLLSVCACQKSQTGCECKDPQSSGGNDGGGDGGSVAVAAAGMPVAGRSVAPKTPAVPGVPFRNSLTALVPDDAAFVLMSQQGRDLRDVGYSTLVFKILRELVGIRLDFAQYQGFANMTGMKPNGDFEFALYLRDYYAVAHITMADAQKALDLLKKHLPKPEDKSCYTEYENGQFVEKCDSGVVISKENDWDVYHWRYSGRNFLPVKVALHQSGDVFSVVVYDKDRPLPDGILSDAKAPFSTQTVDKDAAWIARWDYAAVGEMVLRLPFVVNYLDEQYWYNTDRIYGFVHERDRSALCEAEQLVGCERLWNRLDICDEGIASHCPGNPDDRWNCDWLVACRHCAEDETCYAAMTQRPLLTPQERLQKLGKTSIGDAVCLQEMKSLFAEYPVSEYQLLVSVSGAPGVRMRTRLGSDALVGDIQSKIVEHAVLSNEGGVAGGFVGFDVGSAMFGLIQRWTQKFEYRAFACSQLQALGGINMAFHKEVLSSMMRHSDEPYYFVKNLKTLSFVLRDVDLRGRDIFHFWGYFQNAASGIDLFSREIIEDYNEYGAGNAEDRIIRSMTEGNAMVFATSPYDPKATPFSLVKDEEVLVDAWIRASLITEFVDSDTKFLVSDYHGFVKLQDGVLDISWLPRMEE